MCNTMCNTFCSVVELQPPQPPGRGWESRLFSFKLEQVPEDWAFDQVPEGAKLRLTAAKGSSAGGALKMDLPRAYVEARRGPVGEGEAGEAGGAGEEDRRVRQRVA